MLAEDSKGELIIIEVQNNRELDYFHRMLYGASKAITDYINEGQEYGVIRKVYSINIVYFELGQGKDYVYHGRTSFKGSITMTFFSCPYANVNSLYDTKPEIFSLNITYYE